MDFYHIFTVIFSMIIHLFLYVIMSSLDNQTCNWKCILKGKQLSDCLS